MLDEIEKFLRQAAAKRQAARRPPVRPQPAPPEAEVVEPEIVVYDDAEDVGEHVAHHIDTADVTERASRFGERIGLADDKVEARLHRTFDHRVGQLQDTSKSLTEFEHVEHEESTGARPTKPASRSDNLFQMLRQPQSIRQAIVLSEILNRPEF